MDLTEQIVSWDKSLFTLLNQWGNESLDPFFLSISEVVIWIPLYLFFVFLLFKKFPVKTASIYLLGTVVCVILTDQLSVHAFKNVFERLRPCWNEDLANSIRLVKDGCGGKFGFVSSHATNTFGFAVLMGAIFKQKIPYVAPLLIVWALMISYSRIYLGVHFPLDVIGGGLLGTGIALAIFKVLKQRVEEN